MNFYLLPTRAVSIKNLYSGLKSAPSRVVFSDQSPFSFRRQRQILSLHWRGFQPATFADQSPPVCIPSACKPADRLQAGWCSRIRVRSPSEGSAKSSLCIGAGFNPRRSRTKVRLPAYLRHVNRPRPAKGEAPLKRGRGQAGSKQKGIL